MIVERSGTLCDHRDRSKYPSLILAEIIHSLPPYVDRRKRPTYFGDFVVSFFSGEEVEFFEGVDESHSGSILESAWSWSCASSRLSASIERSCVGKKKCIGDYDKVEHLSVSRA